MIIFLFSFFFEIDNKSFFDKFFDIYFDFSFNIFFIVKDDGFFGIFFYIGLNENDIFIDFKKIRFLTKKVLLFSYRYFFDTNNNLFLNIFKIIS